MFVKKILVKENLILNNAQTNVKKNLPFGKLPNETGSESRYQ